MNWHQLKDGRSIAIDATTFYVKAKDSSVTELKQTLLFYPKKTIFFHADDRKDFIQFDGHYYRFDTQEKREAFIQSLKDCFPAAETMGIRGKTEYPYKPQVIALIVLNLCFWTGMYASKQESYASDHHFGRHFDLGYFVDLLVTTPQWVLITAYILFLAAVILKIDQTSQRIENETVIKITQP